LAVTAHDAAGRALRYARGSARGLLHHALGHNLDQLPAALFHRYAEPAKGPVESAQDNTDSGEARSVH
jgi:hypothetical protein